MQTLPSLALLALLAAPAAAQDAPQPETTTALAPQPAVEAAEFMVVTAHPEATRAGNDALAAGGSAADAAVAVQMMLNLVEPQSSGIGGGAFVLHWDASEGLLTTYDGRETAPAAAGPGLFLTETGEPMEFWDALIGGRSVGVPGTLKLMEWLHDRHGLSPWADLLQPAIDLAEAGFAISPRLAAAIAEAQPQGLDVFPTTKAYFFDADGAPKTAGTLLQNPEFAETLRRIAAEGSAPFYTGDIAEAIVAAVATETNPGTLAADDLATYQVIEREPVCLDYRTRRICGMGPPSSGALTVGQILGILEAFDLAAPGSNLSAEHLFIEASKLAFADRALFMADADFVDMPEGLLNRDYLAARAALIDPGQAMAPASAGNPPWDEARLQAPDRERPEFGTSHFVIVDAQGDMISATTTIEAGFGSRVMTGGFLLNNELTDFAFLPEENGLPVANRVEAGKRPRSAMAPTIVFEADRPVLLIGSPGGARIINYVAEALVRILDFGIDPQTALAMPHVVNRNGDTEVEEGPQAEATIAALAAFGHAASAANLNSGLHAIAITPDGLVGAVDPRREGLAMGR